MVKYENNKKNYDKEVFPYLKKTELEKKANNDENNFRESIKNNEMASFYKYRLENLKKIILLKEVDFTIDVKNKLKKNKGIDKIK